MKEVLFDGNSRVRRSKRPENPPGIRGLGRYSNGNEKNGDDFLKPISSNRWKIIYRRNQNKHC